MPCPLRVVVVAISALLLMFVALTPAAPVLVELDADSGGHGGDSAQLEARALGQPPARP
jgi:hypothetical protein